MAKLIAITLIMLGSIGMSVRVSEKALLSALEDLDSTDDADSNKTESDYTKPASSNDTQAEGLPTQCPPLYPECDSTGYCIVPGTTGGWVTAPSPSTPPGGQYNQVWGYDNQGKGCTQDYTEGSLTITPWNIGEWTDPAVGKELVKVFQDLGYADKMAAMLDAYLAPPETNLAKMQKATGNIEEKTDINYIWTSAGRMALMLEKSIGNQGEKPHTMAAYDEKLRAWVIDLETMYDQLMSQLREKLAAAKAAKEKQEIEKEIEKFDKQNTCENAAWANGIAMTPYPKFSVVSEWINKYFPDLVAISNQMIFYKFPGTKTPPFLQIKVHRTCFFFKGEKGHGTVTVNPELAKAGSNELRDELEPSVYTSRQFTVEIIDKGKTGKLTPLNGQLHVLPMAPRGVKKFDPHAADVETDALNSYIAFKKSHPDTDA